jgi:hypothetical protein
MKFPLVLCIILALLSCAPPQQRSLNLADVRAAFAHLPVTDMVVYDENTDVNHLLKRPGQYVEKANFTDSRIPPDADRKCTIEVFANAEDMKRRKEYVEAIGNAAAVFGTYLYPHKNVLVRIDFKLPPEQADEYKRALESL